MPLSRRRLLPLPLLLLVPSGIGGCKSAGIKDAYTSRDAAGRMKTRSFEPNNAEIHLIVEFVSGREDAVLTLELFGPKDSVAQFELFEIAPGKGDHRIDVKLVIEDEQGQQDDDGPWTPGAYDVDLLIDGEQQETVAFDVLD